MSSLFVKHLLFLKQKKVSAQPKQENAMESSEALFFFLAKCK